jgi:hypothetical protein
MSSVVRFDWRGTVTYHEDLDQCNRGNVMAAGGLHNRADTAEQLNACAPDAPVAADLAIVAAVPVRFGCLG